MPANDFVRYCAICDTGHALAHDAPTDVRRDYPRRIARKQDIDGMWLCAACFAHRQEGRRLDHLKRVEAQRAQDLADLPASVALAEAAFKAADEPES